MRQATKENLMLAATAGRLYHAWDYTKRVREGRSVSGLTLSVMGIDLADGIVARRIGVETPKRRVADSVVDSAIITTGLWVAHKTRPKSKPFIYALATREAFVATGWAYNLATTKQVKKGDDWHKLPSISIAAFCVAANQSSDRVMRLAGCAAVAINTALAYDYYKGWTEPSRNRVMNNGVEEVPGFYDARVAATNFLAQVNLLESPRTPNQLEVVTPQPYIDGTCIEL